jgi:hypothetical protein
MTAATPQGTTREGGCLCGAVRYVVHGPLRAVLICHCVECRRWCGHAWAATAARLRDLEIHDRGHLRWILSPNSEHGASRGFCRRCGSSLFWRGPGWERVSIGAGTLDNPDGLRVVAHIWVEQGADWERPPDQLPAFPRGYPDDAPPLPWGS